MTKEEISALLGRPLTPVEDTNFDLYIDIAEQTLEDLLCTPLEDVEEARVFDTREGYSTAFIDIFRTINEVKINDTVTTDYTVRQWDKRNADWYNSIVFERKLRCDETIEVDAEWGFEEGSGTGSGYPVDLQLLLAGLFGLITKKNKSDATISSKQVEDFRISFNADVDLDQDFYNKYSKTINKYSLCNIPYVRHGKVCNHCGLRSCAC